MIFGEKVFRRLDRVNYDMFVLDAAKNNLLRQLHPFCKDGKIVKVNAGVLLPHELVLKAVKAQTSPLSIARVEVQRHKRIQTSYHSHVRRVRINEQPMWR
jgi:hypothetical protein